MLSEGVAVGDEVTKDDVVTHVQAVVRCRACDGSGRDEVHGIRYDGREGVCSPCLGAGSIVRFLSLEELARRLTYGQAYHQDGSIEHEVWVRKGG